MDINVRNKLVEDNIGLVYYRYIKRFSNICFEKEDIISSGIIGLINAIDNFDGNKGYSFSTYASRCIDNEILKYVNYRNKYISDMHLEDIVCDDLSYNDMIYDDTNIEEDYLYREIISNIVSIINSFSERDRYICYLYFGLQLNQYDIALMVNISQAYVSRKIGNMIRFIKDELGNRGLIDRGNIKCKNTFYNRRKVL